MIFPTLHSYREILTHLAAGLLCQSLASAADPFTIGVIGDQQVPSNRVEFYPSFTTQTAWLAANAQADNIRFVTQVGDIIEHGSNLTQWNRAEAAMVVLDTATNADGGTGIPWNVNYGNHEQDASQPGTDPSGPWANNYRQYFGSASGTHRYANQPEYKGVSTNDLNTWHVIKSSNAVDAREYLMLNLEYDAAGHVPGSIPDPSDIPAFDAIAWAQDIIDQNPGMPTIITTHVFEGSKFGPPNNPYTSGPGRNSQLEIFDKLVKDNSQVFMVLSGHTSEDTHQVKLNTAGLPVLQMVTDYNKVLPNGGNGYMRLVEFDEDADEIRVQTFTPGIPTYDPPVAANYRTDANSEFTISIDWSTRFSLGASGPLMGAPSTSAITDDGATTSCRLVNADATAVTLVWASADQGAVDIASWTSASGGGSHSFGAASENAILSHVLNGLDGDAQYSFRFFATDGVDSDWSSSGTIVTGLGGNPAPANFTGLAGQIANGTKADLSWNDNYAHETGFLLQRSTDPTFASLEEFNLDPGETTFLDDTTSANTAYFYRIAAVGTSGAGPFTANLPVTTGSPGAGPAAGLMGHWKFDEGSGTTAADSSGNGFNAERTITAGSWVTGKAGGAYNVPRFSLDATESNTLNLEGGSVTVSVWVTDRTGVNFEGIAGFEGTGATGDIYGFKMDNADKINWTTIGTSPQKSSDTLANYAAATADGWVHLVGVYDGTTQTSTIYVNGTSLGSVTKAGSIPDKTGPSTFNIGRYYNSSSFAFTGSIDDVQVYNTALTAADVTFLNANPGSTLIAANDFTAWISAFTGLNGQTGFNDDPDGDGLVNGVEAWFGTSPETVTPGFSSLTTDGTISTFTHPRNEETPSNISGIYEWSLNIVDWYDGDGIDGPPSGPTVGVTSESTGATSTVTATSSTPLTQLFLRAKVTQD